MSSRFRSANATLTLRMESGANGGSMNPFVVCLCGSTRFRKEFTEMNRQRRRLVGDPK